MRDPVRCTSENPSSRRLVNKGKKKARGIEASGLPYMFLNPGALPGTL